MIQSHGAHSTIVISSQNLFAWEGCRFASGFTLPSPVTPEVLARPSSFSRRKTSKDVQQHPQHAHPLSIVDNCLIHCHHRSSKHCFATAAHARDRSPTSVRDHHNFLLLALKYPSFSPSPRRFEHYYTPSSPYPLPPHRFSHGATSSLQPLLIAVCKPSACN